MTTQQALDAAAELSGQDSTQRRLSILGMWVGILKALNPAADVTAQNILNNAACFSCLGSEEQGLIALGLQKMVAAQLGAPDTTAQAALNAAACFSCLPSEERGLVYLGLLNITADRS